MLRKMKRVIFLLMSGVFLCGCGHAQDNIIKIGREEETAGSVQLAAIEEVVPEAKGAEVSLNGTAPTDGTGADSKERDSDCDAAELRVYVCGAVNNPGVVTLKPGSRVEDALEAAGGFSKEADRNYVNLADWVADGQQIRFPTKEEAEKLSVNAGEAGQSPAKADSGVVNINTADESVLCTLPGIGEARAQDIITYREKNGRFETEEDIMKVSGIKTAVYEKIRDKITVK